MKLKYGLLWVWLAIAGCAQDEPVTESQPAATEDLPRVVAMPHNELTKVASADGVMIHFDQRGGGDISVVLVHGWSCDSGYWQRQRNWLAQYYRVISIDLAGHGKSGLNRDDWSILAFAEDVAAVTRALDLKNVVLVGHSLGGPVVVAAAELLGDRVIGVVGADTLRNVDQLTTPEQRQAFMKGMDENFTDTVTGFVANMFLADADPGIRDFVIRDMASAPPAIARGAAMGMAEYDTIAGLKALSVPLVLINSDYQANNVAPIEALVEDFQLIAMPGVGHFVMMEAPAIFNSHLDAAIKRFSKE